MSDDISIVELEELLRPSWEKAAELTGGCFDAVAATLEALDAQYGQERIRAMVRELTEMIRAQNYVYIDYEAGSVTE
jgi:hypothetical protein